MATWSELPAPTITPPPRQWWRVATAIVAVALTVTATGRADGQTALQATAPATQTAQAVR